MLNGEKLEGLLTVTDSVTEPTSYSVDRWWEGREMRALMR